MNSYTIKILTFLLSIFILITFASQVYLAFQDNYKTETAVLCNTEQTISFKGIFVRNEKTIEYTGGGVINYPYPDGSKIAKNSPVAEVYANVSDITNKQEIEQIEEELAQLNRIQNKGTAESVQPEYISKLIQEKYQSISECIELNDIKKLKTERQELLTLLNIMQIITGKENDYGERTTYLNEKLSTCLAQKNEPIQSVTTEDAGYFVSDVDGYEDKLTLDNIDNITVNQINEIIKNQSVSQNKSVIGKIIYGYEVKIVGIVDNSNGDLLTQNKFKLKIDGITDSITATLDKIINTDNKNESIIILNCDEMSKDLTINRVAGVNIILNDYDGIKIPRKAIRFLNGEKGVYVVLGQNLQFKKLDIVFETTDYVISRKQNKEGYLTLYDDVIIDGLKEADIKAYESTITSIESASDTSSDSSTITTSTSIVTTSTPTTSTSNS